MRVTSSMYYKNIYEQSNNLLSNQLFDVNKQIASGLKIQYAKDDVITFANTMRLDNKITTLTQTKKSTESGYALSNQSDTTLNEFNENIKNMRKLILNAANGTHSDTSLDSLADELRIIEKHFKNLANTSLNGKYLFAGSATDIKPISADGTYNGNDKAIHSFTGDSIKQQHNVSGAELFLGEEKVIRRKITTNVVLSNLSKKYNYDTKEDNGSLPTPITSKDTIRDLMGDTDDNIDTAKEKHHFYLRGTKSNGDTFKEHLKMRDDETIDSLLTKIGDAFGNTPDLKLVNVSLDHIGNVVIEDKMKGSSKLNFHMVGALILRMVVMVDRLILVI
jgi:flagellar hook-associated protein 3 FlgL